MDAGVVVEVATEAGEEEEGTVAEDGVDAVEVDEVVAATIIHIIRKQKKRKKNGTEWLILVFRVSIYLSTSSFLFCIVAEEGYYRWREGKREGQ